jgi:hypothetical protein
VSLLEQLALGLQAMRHTIAALRRPLLWAPWLVLGAMELAVVLAIWHFAHPALSWVMAPVLRAAAGPEALHFPRSLELLPVLYDRADVVLGGLLGSILIGASTPMFADHFRGTPPDLRAALAMAARRAPALVVVQLPFNLIVTGLLYGVGGWVAAHGGGGRLVRIAGFGLAGASLVVQAALFYVTARMVLGGRGALGSLAGVPSTWRRGFAPALLVGALTLVVLLPLHWLSGQQNLVVARGRPELVGWLALLELTAGLINWFLLTGCATLLYLTALRGAEEER